MEEYKYKDGDRVKVISVVPEDANIFHVGGVYTIHHIDSSRDLWITDPDNGQTGRHYLMQRQVCRVPLDGWETP